MACKNKMTSQFSIRIPQEQNDMIEEYASEMGVDRVTWIRMAIKEKLDKAEMDRRAKEISEKLNINPELKKYIDDLISIQLTEKK